MKSRSAGSIIAPIAVGALTVGAVAYKAIRSGSGPRGSIALAGDSYAAGIGPAIALPPELRQGPDLDFVCTAIPGSTTAQWAAQMEQSTGTHERRWLVFSLGTNDSGRRLDLLSTDIDRIVRVVREHGSGLAWIAPPRAVLEKLPDAEGCWKRWRRVVGEGRCFDTDSHVKVELGPDGLHPIDYRPWAEAFWSWLAVLTA